MEAIEDLPFSTLLAGLALIWIVYFLITDSVHGLRELTMDRLSLGSIRLPSIWGLGSRATKREESDSGDASIDDTDQDRAIAEQSKPAAGGYYPGLVNVGGVSCFLNATLQVC